MANQTHTLIPPKRALKILTFVSRAGLYAGSRGTSRLTPFYAGGRRLYSQEECEALRDEIIVSGEALKDKRENWDKRKIPTELV